MRVALCVEAFPRLSETFVIEQAAALAAAGLEIDILAHARDAQGLVHHAVHEARLMDRASFAAETLEHAAARYVKRPYRLREALIDRGERRAARFRGGRYDVILCHFGTSGVRALSLRDRGHVSGEIWTIFHGYDIARPGKAGRELYADLFARTERFLPVSHFWKERLIELGCPASRIAVRHMGVDCANFPFARRLEQTGAPVSLLSVCRLVEKKGLHIALQALGRLARERPQVSWRYEVVGSGPLSEHLQALADAEGLAERVAFLGARSDIEVRAALDRADVFVLPSVTASNGDMEGIPVALMEAMASGAAVASSFHSGIPELVTHGVAGLLAPEGDVNSLADNLAALIESSGLRATLADQARQVVERRFDSRRLSQDLAHELSCVRSGSRREAEALPFV